MPLVFACIAPHGSIAIPEAKPKDRPSLASATTAGMQELGRRFAAAQPDVSIVLTPHNIHVEGAMAVIDAAAVSGDLVQWGSAISLRIPVDRELALAVRDAIREDGVPVVAVSYGANDPASAVFPMDWAVLIPAHFMGGRTEPQVPVAIVAPARDLSDEVHVRAGRSIGRAAAASQKRVALIASCDHGHGHDAKGPYGFTPKSKEFDEAVVALFRGGDGLRFSGLGSAFAREAKADSYWQMLMLEGALAHDRWKGELLSYEAPTYFGMLCASYAR
ncbi:MAG: extradiol ring-cleavage dioxygenase [Chloroflexi bacterium]|nr:MAG: extradiol ring-cleavage dioxygenase [Chloroflexota bacterium]TMG57717.1 MAG: extradiol ring-cleavage dioxygenase [Chloroflexota bacterium]